MFKNDDGFEKYVERLRRENTGIDVRSRFEKPKDALDVGEVLFFGVFGVLLVAMIYMAFNSDPTYTFMNYPRG